jgi:RES domain-containing protein
MTTLVEHTHVPLFRVGRRSWVDPLDASYSMRVPGNRWNTQAFPALYCCCSEKVAGQLVQDRLRHGNLLLDDLQDECRPRLFEISWEGRVVDLASPEGLQANGFPPTYPDGVEVAICRDAAEKWHAEGHEGVLCRSAAAFRMGERKWEGDHRGWGEVAVWVRNARRQPKLVRPRDDEDWLFR